jgi:hypothetical protein
VAGTCSSGLGRCLPHAKPRSGLGYASLQSFVLCLQYACAVHGPSGLYVRRDAPALALQGT